VADNTVMDKFVSIPLQQHDVYPLEDPVDDSVVAEDIDLSVRPNGCSMNYSIAFMNAIEDSDEGLDARLAECIDLQNREWQEESGYLPLPQNGATRVAVWTALSLLNDALQAPSAYHADALVSTRFQVGEYDISARMFDSLYHVSRFADRFFKNGVFIRSGRRMTADGRTTLQ